MGATGDAAAAHAGEAATEDDPQQLVARIQELQAQLESGGDPATRELADELISAIVQMYGAGLERIIAALW